MLLTRALWVVELFLQRHNICQMEELVARSGRAVRHALGR
jgi:hypothetical protein